MERQVAVVALAGNRRRGVFEYPDVGHAGAAADGARLTLGAALSNSTRERPCASLPVTTRRIGLGVSLIMVSPLSLTLAETWPDMGQTPA